MPARRSPQRATLGRAFTVFSVASLCLVSTAALAEKPRALTIRDAQMEPVSWSALDGWGDDDQAAAYAGTALLEGTNVNIKGPAQAPFLRFGAPWIKGVELARYLNARAIPGVRFLAVSYVPAGEKYYPFVGQRIEGVEIMIRDRDVLDAPALGIEAVAALWKLYGEKFEIEKVDRLLRDRRTLDAIKAGTDPRAIVAGWRAGLDAYKARRARFLLY